MIDVLHLIDTYRIGGPGKTILNSARYIDRDRFRIHIGSFVSSETGTSEFSEAARQAGIGGFTLIEARRVELSPPATIRRYLAEHHIKIVHCHGYRMDVFGFWAARRSRVALVTTHHGWIRNNWRQRLFSQLALRISPRFHGIELVADVLRRELPASVRNSDIVAVVRNGIVVDDYAPRGYRDEVRASLGVGAGDMLLGAIGRLSMEKGCLEMLDAFTQVAAQRPSARLLLLGDGPLLPRLRAAAEASGCVNRIHFVAHQKKVAPFYEAIDIMVSPSRTEGLSNVILEGMAAGRPIIATRVGGNSEILTNEVSGLMVEPERPDELARAIMRLMDDPSLQSALVEAATARVREEFLFESRMRREEQFYERALARAARGRAN